MFIQMDCASVGRVGVTFITVCWHPLIVNMKEYAKNNGSLVSMQGDGAQPEGKGRAAAAATFQAFMQFLKELSSADSAGRVLVSNKCAPPAPVCVSASVRFAW